MNGNGTNTNGWLGKLTLIGEIGKALLIPVLAGVVWLIIHVSTLEAKVVEMQVHDMEFVTHPELQQKEFEIKEWTRENYASSEVKDDIKQIKDDIGAIKIQIVKLTK